MHVRFEITQFVDVYFRTNHELSVPQTRMLQMKFKPNWARSDEGESISNRLIPFPIDRDGQNFHVLFQYMFYTWVQNYTLIESFFNKILTVKHC